MEAEQKVRLDLSFGVSGWLDGRLTVGSAAYSLGASCIEDTPAQLLDATRAACLGSERDVVWLEEPGAAVWRLQAAGGALRLTLGEAATWPQAAWSPGPESATHLMTRVGWLRAVIRGMSALGEDQERYQAGWRRAFPTASLRAVRDLLAEERARG